MTAPPADPAEAATVAALRGDVDGTLRHCAEMAVAAQHALREVARRSADARMRMTLVRCSAVFDALATILCGPSAPEIAEPLRVMARHATRFDPFGGVAPGTPDRERRAAWATSVRDNLVAALSDREDASQCIEDLACDVAMTVLAALRAHPDVEGLAELPRTDSVEAVVGPLERRIRAGLDPRTDPEAAIRCVMVAAGYPRVKARSLFGAEDRRTKRDVTRVRNPR